jgi:Uma2 family endonuclease
VNTARKLACYEDVLATPDHLVAELIQGLLHTTPRPGPKHASVAMLLGTGLHAPFDRGRGGPGGWIILMEPELHLGEHVLVPDLAAWRRERMPELPETAYFGITPDWVCEVISPSTARLDRAVKLPLYARQGVDFAWIIDPQAQTLEVLKRQQQSWLLLSTFVGTDIANPAPFDALPFALGQLWDA